MKDDSKIWSSPLRRKLLNGSVYDWCPAEVKVVFSLQVHRARGIQGEPVWHKYRGYPLCAGQE